MTTTVDDSCKSQRSERNVSFELLVAFSGSGNCDVAMGFHFLLVKHFEHILKKDIFTAAELQSHSALPVPHAQSAAQSNKDYTTWNVSVLSQSFSTSAAMQFPKQQIFTQQFLIALRIKRHCFYIAI